MTIATLLRRYGTLIGFALILGFFWFNLPDTFMTARNWLNITQQLSMLMVVAAGMTIVMVMGDFDLSVARRAIVRRCSRGCSLPPAIRSG